jgi:hypothetical protein
VIERGVRVVIDESQRDFGGGTPECDADWFSAVVVNADGAGGSGRSLDDVAAIDPRVTVMPSLCAFGGYDGGVGRC